MQTRLILGVSGGSGSGKHRIIHHHLLPVLGDRALILEHDWYFHEVEYLLDRQHVSTRLEINYDVPEAYENALLVEHLEALRSGHPIEVHPYQKWNGYRLEEPLHLEPRDVVIVDGMMVLAVPELVRHFDLKIFVEAEDALRLKRRVARDLSFCPAEENEVRFYRDVLPAHRKFIEPSRALADYVLLNTRDGDEPEGLDPLLEALRAALAGLK